MSWVLLSFYIEKTEFLKVVNLPKQRNEDMKTESTLSPLIGKQRFSQIPHQQTSTCISFSNNYITWPFLTEKKSGKVIIF